MGGMLAAIAAGYPQREIERAAYDYQKAVEETTIPILKIDPALERAQVERVRKVRVERDGGYERSRAGGAFGREPDAEDYRRGRGVHDAGRGRGRHATRVRRVLRGDMMERRRNLSNV
jgi:hypothetical protein